MTVNRGMSLPRALYSELRTRPLATSVALGSIYLGTCALILGVESSRAFTVIAGQGGGTAIARIMGAVLVAGGLLATAGAVRMGAMVLLVGDALISVGALIYGGGVLIGLHKGGLIASGLAFIICTGMGLRVLLLSAAPDPPAPSA